METKTNPSFRLTYTDDLVHVQRLGCTNNCGLISARRPGAHLWHRSQPAVSQKLWFVYKKTQGEAFSVVFSLH